MAEANQKNVSINGECRVNGKNMYLIKLRLRKKTNKLIISKKNALNAHKID